MTNFRKVEMSDNLFGGYHCSVDLDAVDSLQEIVDQIVAKLTHLIEENGLSSLKTELQNKDFHIHSFQFGEILMSEPDATIWVCGHHSD